MVAPSELLGALPGHEHLHMSFVGLNRGGEPRLLPLREAFLAAAQQIPDPGERVFAAASVPGEGLLDPASDLVDDLGAELDDVEGVED